MIQAEYFAPNSLVCMPGVNDFRQLRYINTSNVRVLWTGPNVEYYLETEIDPLTGMIYTLQLLLCTCVFILTVILYDCSALAEVCSSCLSASNLLSLDCGWCHDSGSCVVTESCSIVSSTDSDFTVSNSDTCPSPQITVVCSMLQCGG